MERNRSLCKFDLLKLVKNCNSRVLIKPGITLLLFLLTITSGFAQTHMLTGKVTNSQNEPLPGVNVVIKGTLNGTVTDIDGNFKLEAAETDLLVFSFIGLSEQEVEVGSQNTFSITMMEATSDLNEVVVVGYGVQRKSVVTAAISSIKAEDLEKTAMGRVEHAIQGKTAGVSVLPTSGSPGAGVKIRIRGVGSNGNTDPLYIVDGMKTSSIDDIDPNDIGSIEILKDAASAAIYGTEGANGVILISTKKGKTGKSQISYNLQYGIQNLSTNMDLMDAGQYIQYMTEAGESITVGEENNTDWLNEISESATMQHHHISMTGGNEKSTYLLSASYLDQDGAIGGSNANFKRYTFRINTKNNIKPWLEVGNNLNFSHSKRKLLPEDDEYRSIVNNALLMDPLTPVYDNAITPAMQEILDVNPDTPFLKNSDGKYYALNRVVTGETANPVAFIENTHNTITTDKLLASFYGTIKPIKGFSITSRVGLELTYITQKSWEPLYYFSLERSNSVNTMQDWIDKHNSVLWENFASYNKKINDHDFTIMAGMSYEDYTHPDYYLKSLMPKEGSQYAYHNYSVEKTTNRVGGDLEEITKISYFGRLSYNYLSKYMIEASLRRDAASILPPDNRWANFTALSGGWVISEEDFWFPDIIQFAKIRASWGQNGSINNVIPFSDREFWVSENVSYSNEDEELVQGVRINSPTNKLLSWEKSEQTDIGLDLRFLKNRFNFSVDYYKKTTKGLIVAEERPGSAGAYNQPSTNGGTVENKGLEFEAGYTNKTAGGLKYAININLTTLKNKVTDLANDTPIPGATVRGYTMTYFAKNQPLWYFYGYKTNGIDPLTGEVIVVDVNDDKKITPADQTQIGDPHPDLNYGASISLEYKNFDFNMFLQGTKGNDIYMAWFRTDRSTTNKPAFFYTDRWTGVGSNSSMPAPNNESDYIYRSDLMVRDGSYMRIKQIQLGYTVPKEITSSIGINKVRAYISLDDYFTFTKYEGMDPEAGSSADNRQGIDKGLYPLTKKVMFGLSVNF